MNPLKAGTTSLLLRNYHLAQYKELLRDKLSIFFKYALSFQWFIALIQQILSDDYVLSNVFNYNFSDYFRKWTL